MFTAYKEAIVGISLYEEKLSQKLNKNILHSEDHINWHLRNKSSKLDNWCKLNYMNLNENKLLEKITVKQHLKKIIKYFSKLNMDIINLKLNDDKMCKYNLFVSKVIIPGLLPMTFGEKNARTIGKVYNEEPHPFP